MLWGNGEQASPIRKGREACKDLYESSDGQKNQVTKALKGDAPSILQDPRMAL